MSAFNWFRLFIMIATPIYFLVYLARSAWLGEIRIKGGWTFRKDKNPSMFWVSIGLVAFISGILLLAVIYSLVSRYLS